MTLAIENLVRITFSMPESELTADQKAARECLETAINQVVEQFVEGPEATSDMPVEIELFPCPDDCIYCKAA